MGVTAAQLVAQVSVTGATEAKAELKGMSGAVSETSSGFKSMLGNALSFAAGQAVFNAVGNAVGFLRDQFADSVQIAMQHQDIMSQTVKVLQSTHDASGETATAIDSLSESLSKTTYYGEDAIQTGENLLLTFTGIGKDVFPQATKTLLDMAKAMGGDPKSAAIELGKALNDPAQGLTALTRIGVTFTDSQKKAVQQMEAAGNTAGAQKIILGELNREFGGSSDATKTFAGQMALLQNSFEDAKQKVGTALLPILSQLSGFISAQIMPQVDRFSDWFTVTALPAMQSFAGMIQGNAIPALQSIGDKINKFAGTADSAKPILAALGVTIAALLVPSIWSFAAGVIAATWPILAIAGAVTGLVLIFEHFYNSNAGFKSFIDGLAKGFAQVWGDIQANFLPTMQRLGGFFQTNILPILRDIGGFLLTTFMPVWKQLQQLWSSEIVPLMQQLWGALQPALPAFKFLGEVVGGIVVVSFGLLVGIITGVVKAIAGVISGLAVAIGGIIQIFTGVVQVISGIVRFLYDLFTGNFKALGSDLGTIWQGIINIFSGAWKVISGIFLAAWGAISGFVSGLVQGVIGFFTHLWDELVGHSIIPDMINSILGFFESLPGKVFGFVEDLVSGMLSRIGSLKDQAVSKFQDLVSGVQGIFGTLGSGIKGIWNGIIGDAKGGINSIIGVINGFINGLDRLHVSLPGGGSLGFNIPDIPLLASGGSVVGAGLAIVGERGPEGVYLPAGAQVIPNSQMFGFGGGGQQQPIIVQAVLQVNGRLMTLALLPHMSNTIRHATGIWST